MPDNLRQALRLLGKYHFWILAALVPAIAIPTLFIGTGILGTKIDVERRKIDSALAQVRAVTSTSPHPNAAWARQIDEQAASLSRETFAEWQALWDAQRSLRTWPEELGADFLKAVAERGGSARLDRPLLLRYQKLVPRLARGLPRRMGVADQMAEPGDSAQPGAEAAGAAATSGLAWAAADQRRIYEAFVWEKPPTPALVMLAQEELWVYGTLCDLVRQFNADAAARGRECAIATVEMLAIGHDAVEGRPASRSQRIFVPTADRDAGMPEPPPPFEPLAVADPGEAVERPVNPRFSRGARGGTDDALRNWIYVGFDGVPLSAADVATKPEARMVHLMPFVLQITIDQRDVDAFVATCAAWPVPLDVRQVRINPRAGAGPRPDGGGDDSRPTRPLDMQLELHGTVGLATPPVKDPVGPPEAGA